MDLTRTIEADSTQVNADELTDIPRIVTITAVTKGSADQPVNIELAEYPGKAYRPCKSMRRVLVQCWGPDASTYIGRRLAIYNDRSVRWGGQAVGGVRIKALSHIDKPITLALTVTRGKRAPYTVEPLAEAAPKPIPDDFADKLRGDITREALAKARTYLEGKRADFPERATELLDLVAAREAELAQEATE